MGYQKIFAVLFVLSSVACGPSYEGGPSDDQVNEANTKIMKQGCYISVGEVTDENKNKVWKFLTDCSGVEGTCVGTAAALRTLNDYRALLFGSRNHETLSGRDKALNDGIGEGISKILAVRNAISPTCAK